MESIFRTATTQAILDIISDHSTESRFGSLLTPEDRESIAERVVDLFEMTLELRNRTGIGRASGAGHDTEDGVPRSNTPHSAPVANNLSRNTLGRAMALPKRQRNWVDEEPHRAFPLTIHADEFTEQPASQRRMRTPESPVSSEDANKVSPRLPRERRTLSEQERLRLEKNRVSS